MMGKGTVSPVKATDEKGKDKHRGRKHHKQHKRPRK